MKKDVTQTHLLGRSLVDKDSDIVWAVGSVDEANAFIGLAKVYVKDEKIKETLSFIQRKMFKAGMEIVSKESVFSDEDFNEIMGIIKEFEKEVVKPRKFIILEKDEATAYLSVARAVVRRAERWGVRLHKKGLVPKPFVEWMNKLSYLIYLMILKESNGKFEEL
ncbi:ATP:cob(I)alamin adenosyltransferase [Archaeoglobales archaeon]|nr:MAG: ATP:cob(I)alamin adenosyltransferase [Archaeoglobales archaeon]